MKAQEKIERFVFNHVEFKKWWAGNSEVTGDENTAWLAWCAALSSEAEPSPDAEGKK